MVVLGIALLSGCVKTGSVTEQQPLSQKVPRAKTVGIVVNAANAEWRDDADHLRDGLHHELAEHGWPFNPNPDFVFEITFVEFDKGSKGARMFGAGGEAELHCDVVLKTREGAVIAKLAVTGNSKRQSSTSIGGFNTSYADSLPARAVRATIEQISEYLQSHA